MSEIRLRSPYYLKITDEDATYDIDEVTLTLKYINGSITAIGGQPVRYTLTKKANGNSYVVFEISELMRDYITTEFDGTYDNRPIWIYAVVTAVDSSSNAVSIAINGGTAGTTKSLSKLAYDAYSTFKDGANYEVQGSSYFLTNATKIRIPKGQIIRVPVNQKANDPTSVTGGTAAFYTLNPETAVGPVTNITTPSTGNDTIAYVENDADSSEKLLVKDSGNTTIAELDVIEEDCTKYGFAKVTYYNSYGALQDLYFFGKTIESINTTGEQYKANVVDLSSTPTPTYDVNKHQYNQYNKQGVRSIQLNSGYVGDDYNILIEELMLSEKVWITYENVLYPAKPKTMAQTFKTVLNDSLVNYTVDFDYAFDAVQNIR